MKPKLAILSIISVGMFVVFACAVAVIGIVALNFLLRTGPNIVYMNI